ncbi:hypothetical protein GCM10012289_13670 [Nonomuraea cavernae]|uniref:Uncharacterized protein n=1 Tax=Nonomuraea cavernae TaxID=2045107 RepID=A0A917YTZ9_9ACTN|nr:hypothetical protein GCM10012289_13670 [Nonomuraea cavernae]
MAGLTSIEGVAVPPGVQPNRLREDRWRDLAQAASGGGAGAALEDLSGVPGDVVGAYGRVAALRA